MRELVIGSIFVALTIRPVFATTAADLCAPTADPCVVAGAIAVGGNSTLDLGGRALVITGSGSLDVGGGDVLVFAGRLEMQPGARFLSKGGSIDVTTLDAIDVQATDKQARVDVSGNDGGFVSLVAGGALTIDGQVLANALAASGDGGSVDVEGLGVEIGAAARLSAEGGRSGFGGDITVEASAGCAVSGTIDASAGSDGGPICIEAENDLVVGPTAMLDGRSGAGGVGDELDLTSFSGSVTLAGTVTGQAAGSADLGGGSGMALVVDADADVAVDATIELSGAGSDGSGGSADFGGSGDVTYQGTIDVSAPGGFGSGGEVSFSTDTGLVDVQGDVDASGPASAGAILVQSFGDVRISGALVADGPPGFLASGVDVEGCAIDVPTGAELSSAKVSAAGQGTQNTLKASGQMTIAGLLAAGVGNRLEYRDPAAPPILTGASITPAATVVNNPALVPCGGPITTTTTTTSTSTSSTSTTPTTTTTTTSSTESTTSSTSTSSTETTTTTSTTEVTLPPTTSTSSTTSTSETTSSSQTTTSSTTSTTTPRVVTTTTTSVPTTSTTLPPRASCEPATCDDGDGCTDDSCDPQRGCVHAARTGFDAVTCRLAAIATALRASSAHDLGGAGAQARLAASVGKIEKIIDGARAAHGRPLVVRVKRAKKLLGSFLRTIRKGQQRGRIPANVADRIEALGNDAASQLSAIASSR